MKRWVQMPRYFFHLHNDIDAPDLEGAELPDLDTVRLRATSYAVDMAAVSIREHRKFNPSHHIQVTDQFGDTILIVKFGDVVKIESPSSGH